MCGILANKMRYIVECALKSTNDAIIADKMVAKELY